MCLWHFCFLRLCHNTFVCSWGVKVTGGTIGHPHRPRDIEHYWVSEKCQLTHEEGSHELKCCKHLLWCGHSRDTPQKMTFLSKLSSTWFSYQRDIFAECPRWSDVPWCIQISRVQWKFRFFSVTSEKWLHHARSAQNKCFKYELKECFKDTGLYTIVIPSTSSHPTLLEHKYEGYLNYPGSMFCSNITSAVAKCDSPWSKLRSAQEAWHV
jgi:hypothetical protein